MKIENIEDKHQEVIRYIVSTGVGVLYIDNELFLVHRFIAADNAIRKTVIEGIDITAIVVNQALGVKVTVQQQQTLATQLQNAQAERREYSEQFKWILYT